MKTAIIVCARLKSRRLPNKCALEINGKSVLHHLHSRLVKTGIPVIYAVPQAELEEFVDLTCDFERDFSLYSGYDEDPLARQYHAAREHDVDAVIRVTHDKIFVDTESMFMAIDEFRRTNLHYVYGSGFVAGTGFEVIAIAALEEAVKRFKNVEHVSYAIRTVTDRKLDIRPAIHADFEDVRLLIDFPEDIELMTRIFGILGNDCTLGEVLTLMNAHSWLQRVNKTPLVTIYTCAYNAQRWIEKCMGSVAEQTSFANYEYILVDDCSKDATALLMARFASMYANTRYIRNARNLGLASSSNVALTEARGSFIMRLDADDYLTSPASIKELLTAIAKTGSDVIYPSNYCGSMKAIQRGDDQHHVGGALFRTRAINHIKFTDGLRGYEGYDFFTRAKSQLKIGYLNRPTFFYRQHDSSMSKTNLEERARLKEEIDKRHADASQHGGI